LHSEKRYDRIVIDLTDGKKKLFETSIIKKYATGEKFLEGFNYG